MELDFRRIGRDSYCACLKCMIRNDPAPVFAYATNLSVLFPVAVRMASTLLRTQRQMRRYLDALANLSDEIERIRKSSMTIVSSEPEIAYRSFSTCLLTLSCVCRVSKDSKVIHKIFNRESARWIKEKHVNPTAIDKAQQEDVYLSICEIVLGLRQNRAVPVEQVDELVAYTESLTVVLLAFFYGDEPIVESFAALFEVKTAQQYNDFVRGLWDAMTEHTRLIGEFSIRQ